jgi:CheY-like chemotaxis protein
MTPQPTPVRVLVVDDDAMSRDLLGILLEGEGYTVECAGSGDAALALLGDGHAVPQIVLTDIQMPGTTGTRLADGLRQACGPSTLLLAMSGSGPAPDAISQFDGFLLKPFTVLEMMAAISERGNSETARAPLISPPVAARRSRTASKPKMEGHVQEVGTGNAEVELAKDGSPALDERIYRQLTDAMPGQQLQQMYAMCVKDARDRITTMRGLVAERDGAQFVREAHSIKGGCGMLGASEIYGMAARLETSGLDAPGLGGAQGVNPLDELTAACDRLERILGSRV